MVPDPFVGVTITSLLTDATDLIGVVTPIALVMGGVWITHRTIGVVRGMFGL